MRRPLIALLGAAALVSGCGGKKTTVTVIETSPAAAAGTGAATGPGQSGGTSSTVSTAPQTAQGGQPIPPSQPKPPDAEFCQGSKGDQVRAASADATTAFNKTDAKAFQAAADKALSISKDAPPGSACVKDALNGIAGLAQDGEANLKGIDVKALVARIHKFEDDHGIDHP
jgi:hypothetical protein